MIIEPLSAQQVNRLCLAEASLFTPETLVKHLQSGPAASFWLPQTGEYVISGYWKRRPEIGFLAEMSATRSHQVLFDAVLEAFRRLGSRLVIIADSELRFEADFYRRQALSVLEEVILYQKPDTWLPAAHHLPRLQIRPLMPDDLPALVRLEERTFPWLWWNTAEEFLEIAASPHRQVALGWYGKTLVGYIILARHVDIGHLDRLGVDPNYQGQGFGAELLTVALQTMSDWGARRFGLSTQIDNARSQRLYEAFGFVRQAEGYQIRGRWL